MDSFKERYSRGRELRREVPRSSHAAWEPPPDRPDPISLLEASNQGRVPELIPLRHTRMVASPFAFLRGSAVVMTHDLARSTPTTGIEVQLCGDAHLANVGIFASPERNLLMDLNDFDETHPGPWEWDLKRMAASFTVAGRYRGFPLSLVEGSTQELVRSYRQRMRELASLGTLEVWYDRMSPERILEMLHPSDRRRTARKLERIRRSGSSRELYAKMVEVVDGRPQIREAPPKIERFEGDDRRIALRALFEVFRDSLPYERRALIDQFTLVDFARKVVGVGSVGTRCFVALFLGKHDGDPLFLQFKEARASVLEPHTRPSIFACHGERVVIGQRLLQAASDIFLGWGRAPHPRNPEQETHFYFRQLRDMKGGVDLERVRPEFFLQMGRVYGWILARAHARLGAAPEIAGYLGAGDMFDRAITEFARLYADQTERDHALMEEAVQLGRLPVSPEER